MHGTVVGISGRGWWSLGVAQQGHRGTTETSFLSYQPLFMGETHPGWAALGGPGPSAEGTSWGQGINSEPGTVLVLVTDALS